MAGHRGFLKFKTRPGRCDMVIINSPLKGLNNQKTKYPADVTYVCMVMKYLVHLLAMTLHCLESHL